MLVKNNCCADAFTQRKSNKHISQIPYQRRGIIQKHLHAKARGRREESSPWCSLEKPPKIKKPTAKAPLLAQQKHKPAKSSAKEKKPRKEQKKTNKEACGLGNMREFYYLCAVNIVLYKP